MQQNINKLATISLKAAFIDASLYKICNSLISYSAAIIDNKVIARIVVHQNISDLEEDAVMDILGDVMGHFPDATADFKLVKIGDGKISNDSDNLPIMLFRRAL